METTGNPYGHLILRGGANGPNYDTKSVLKAEMAMRSAQMKPLIMSDCSHGNSGKDHLKVEGVFKDVMEQVFSGNRSIIGVMIESHIHAGNQPLEKNGNINDLKYGVSITRCTSF